MPAVNPPPFPVLLLDVQPRIIACKQVVVLGADCISAGSGLVAGVACMHGSRMRGWRCGMHCPAQPVVAVGQPAWRGHALRHECCRCRPVLVLLAAGNRQGVLVSCACVWALSQHGESVPLLLCLCFWDCTASLRSWQSCMYGGYDTFCRDLWRGVQDTCVFVSCASARKSGGLQHGMARAMLVLVGQKTGWLAAGKQDASGPQLLVGRCCHLHWHALSLQCRDVSLTGPWLHL